MVQIIQNKSTNICIALGHVRFCVLYLADVCESECVCVCLIANAIFSTVQSNGGCERVSDSENRRGIPHNGPLHQTNKILNNSHTHKHTILLISFQIILYTYFDTDKVHLNFLKSFLLLRVASPCTKDRIHVYRPRSLCERFGRYVCPAFCGFCFPHFWVCLVLF